jgi:crotonobetainyl-CoA:carnitine CoA-transferase CaiB-like acyl-CoA transferase
MPLMSGPMSGIKVVELGVWVAGPSCAGILADWGAEVVKIEPPDGDPFRGLYGSSGINGAFELDNRGKRSMALDLGTDRGRAIVHELLGGADVLVTNLRARVLERWGFDHQSLQGRYPRLIYASVSGYGWEGPEKDRASYDFGGFWARSGMASALTRPGEIPPAARGGMGDHTTAMGLCAGVSAALFERERTGAGQHVSTSLFRAGVFVMGWDTSLSLRSGAPNPTGGRRERAGNPAFNSYADSERRWFWLLGLQADRHWPDLMRAVGHPELIERDGYRTLRERLDKAEELVAMLDEIFARRPLSEWGPIFDREDVWWAPVQTTEEVLRDPQAQASGVFVEAPVAGGTAKLVATPVDFSTSGWAPTRACPELGEHTEELLLELGYDWDRIIELKEASVIP